MVLMADVAELDVRTAPEADLRGMHDIAIELAREELPADPPAPYEKFAAEIHNPAAYRRGWYYTARLGGEVAGYAHVYVDDVGDNEHLAYVEGGVLPELRRQRVGTALLAAVAGRAQAAGRRLLMSAAPDGHEGAESFFQTFGGERRYVERRSRLLVEEVDHSLMKEWIEGAADRAGDYELFGWDGPCPDELVADYARLLHVMNTAPIDDLDFDDEVFTPQRLRADEARLRAVGSEWSTLVVRRRPTGELAGLTELVFPRWRDWLAYQGNTGVDPIHRNRGIGRWLKAAMIEKVSTERSSLRWVDTWNANSNDPMLHINVAMGFTPLVYMGGWQTPVETVAAKLEERQ